MRETARLLLGGMACACLMLASESGWCVSIGLPFFPLLICTVFPRRTASRARHHRRPSDLSRVDAAQRLVRPSWRAHSRRAVARLSHLTRNPLTHLKTNDSLTTPHQNPLLCGQKPNEKYMVDIGKFDVVYFVRRVLPRTRRFHQKRPQGCLVFLACVSLILTGMGRREVYSIRCVV